MSKRAHYGLDGRIVAFYDDAVHAAIPEPSVIITDAQWQDHLTRRSEITIEVGTGTIVETPINNSPVLNDMRRAGVRKVQRKLSTFLNTFTRDYPDQEIASWGTKAMMAQAHLGGDPQPALIAEATEAERDVGELATHIVARAAQHTNTVFRASGIRSKAWDDVYAATSAEAIDAVILAAETKINQLAADVAAAQS